MPKGGRELIINELCGYWCSHKTLEEITSCEGCPKSSNKEMGKDELMEIGKWMLFEGKLMRFRMMISDRTILDLDRRQNSKGEMREGKTFWMRGTKKVGNWR